MVTFNNVSFAYSNEEQKVATLSNINLTIEPGECVVLCGDSGCGKTSMIRLINGLIPSYYEGELQGEVTLNNNPIQGMELYEIAGKVGSVFQNPKSQFFSAEVESELAFVCENLGFHHEEIEQRTKKAIEDFKINHLIDKKVSVLSGGEKQKIACACVTTPNPEIYVFDEPSSNLDSNGISMLRECLLELEKKKKTIVIAEHRLYYLTNIATKYVYMKQGEISQIFTREEFLALDSDERKKMGLRCTNLEEIEIPVLKDSVNNESLKLKNFTYSFEKKEGLALNIPELVFPRNKITAIVGNNGSGKSTFANCLSGIYKNKGLLEYDNTTENYKKRLSSIFLVMQDSNHQLFTDSVLDEVLISLPVENEDIARKILDKMDLLDFETRHPISLSGGQKQRTAIATAIASDREIIIFDEPTSGLDYKNMKNVSEQLKNLQKSGKTIIVITHDLELIYDCAEYVVELENAELTDSYYLYEKPEKLISSRINKIAKRLNK